MTWRSPDRGRSRRSVRPAEIGGRRGRRCRHATPPRRPPPTPRENSLPDHPTPSLRPAADSPMYWPRRGLRKSCAAATAARVHLRTRIVKRRCAGSFPAASPASPGRQPRQPTPRWPMLVLTEPTRSADDSPAGRARIPLRTGPSRSVDHLGAGAVRLRRNQMSAGTMPACASAATIIRQALPHHDAAALAATVAVGSASNLLQHRSRNTRMVYSMLSK